ncbi:MAG TPA: hypothetical protein PK141_19145 [Polyangiaceae bacterium]|nr:hypothetical protein [Polyangiaceae bacterium]
MVGATLTMALLGACGATDERADVTLDARFVSPKGLLDTVSRITLVVYDKSDAVTCDPARGASTAKPDTPKIATRELSRAGCADRVKFCGDVRVTRSDLERVFVASASDDAGDTIAQGCAVAKVNQDAVPLEIKMVRAIPPSTCGNKVIEGLEQCDPPGAACSATCKTEETALSVGSILANTKTGGPNEKSETSLLATKSRFFAFFTDKSSGKADVGVRALDATFGPVSSPPAAAQGFVYLPNGSNPPEPATRAAGGAEAAALADTTWVAFHAVAADGAADVFLRSFDAELTPGQAASIGVNGANGAGEAGAQTSPSVAAGANGKLYIAWQDESGGAGNGRIFARTFTPPNVLGNQQEISTGTSNSHVSVAALPAGFVIVWESGGDVKLRVVNGDGIPAGGESVVNDKAAGVQERPHVASLDDGRFAVVWADKASGNADVVLQRFSAQIVKLAGDQAAPINDLVRDGDQAAPRVAATTAGAGVYFVAWADEPRGDIRGRYVRLTTGFPFNPVDGTDSEFSVGTRSGRKRAAPSVAIGGATPFLAVAWDDQAAQGAGVYGRRLPVPAK